jgi:hypothetical protein
VNSPRRDPCVSEEGHLYDKASFFSTRVRQTAVARLNRAILREHGAAVPPNDGRACSRRQPTFSISPGVGSTHGRRRVLIAGAPVASLKL